MMFIFWIFSWPSGHKIIICLVSLQDGAELKSLASGAPLCCRQNEETAADDCDGAGSRSPLERASSCPGAMHGASWRFDNRCTCVRECSGSNGMVAEHRVGSECLFRIDFSFQICILQPGHHRGGRDPPYPTSASSLPRAPHRTTSFRHGRTIPISLGISAPSS